MFKDLRIDFTRLNNFELYNDFHCLQKLYIDKEQRNKQLKNDVEYYGVFEEDPEELTKLTKLFDNEFRFIKSQEYINDLYFDALKEYNNRNLEYYYLPSKLEEEGQLILEYTN